MLVLSVLGGCPRLSEHMFALCVARAVQQTCTPRSYSQSAKARNAIHTILGFNAGVFHNTNFYIKYPFNIKTAYNQQLLALILKDLNIPALLSKMLSTFCANYTYGVLDMTHLVSDLTQTPEHMFAFR